MYVKIKKIPDAVIRADQPLGEGGWGKRKSSAFRGIALSAAGDCREAIIYGKKRPKKTRPWGRREKN